MFARPRFIHKNTRANSGSSLPPGTVASNYVAGAAIGGHRVVRTQADGTVIYADKDDVNIANDHLLGISNNAAIAGDGVEVVTYGPMEEASWAWDTTLLLFLGDTGQLVQVQPSAGFSCVIGKVLTPTLIFVDIQRPIVLA